MSDLEYPACINELYQSEVLGERAFLALMAAAKNERKKYHFGTFSRVGIGYQGASAAIRLSAIPADTALTSRLRIVGLTPHPYKGRKVYSIEKL